MLRFLNWRFWNTHTHTPRISLKQNLKVGAGVSDFQNKHFCFRLMCESQA